MILKILEYSHILAYTRIASTRESDLDLTQLKYLHYSHRPSIWLLLFEYASNTSQILPITHIVQIFQIMLVIWTMRVYTHIICITHITRMDNGCNSKYLLILLVLFKLFKLFEVFVSMRVINSNTRIDMSLCDYSTHITHIDSNWLAKYSTCISICEASTCDFRVLETDFLNIRSCLQI